MSTTDWKDGCSFTGAANNATIGPFTLLGGLYALALSSTTTVSATLEILQPDGSTFVAVAAAQTAAFATYSLPPGTYQIVCGAAFGTGQGALVKVPYKAA